jgi:hypothetical protein
MGWRGSVPALAKSGERFATIFPFAAHPLNHEREQTKMKEKTLADFPEYARIQTAVEKLPTEKAEVAGRLEQIAIELSRPQEQQLVDGKESWNLALEGEGSVRSRYATDNRSELRDEQSELEARLRFCDEALSVGLQELDKVVGQCSLKICQGIRKVWVLHVAQVLEHLKGICESNAALDRMRSDLERQGVRTDSLAYAKFDLNGSWSDPLGGKVTGHQHFIAEHYPELTAAAGMEIKSKLAALAKREQAFEEKGAVE